MESYQLIGIVGATGLVGKELLQLLVTNNFINLKLCASDKSYGQVIKCNDKEYTLEYLNNDFFTDLPVVFFCADNTISEKWISYALEKNIFVIDNSSAYRMYNKIPLVIPEINGHLISINNLIANPNCSTVILCMVLYPLSKLAKISRVDVSTYQAVSGAGILALEEMYSQANEFSCSLEITKPKIFKSQILFNCFSHDSTIDLDSGYNGEELKIINETRKILNDPELKISATCVRIPVMRSHSEAVKIVFDKPVLESDIIKTLEHSIGIKIINDRETNTFPEPLTSSGTHDVYVGRIRKDYIENDGTVYHMFLCGDQLLKGAALNAYQIFKHKTT